MCDNIGYELFNIWEDDWLYKRDIIKSMIRNKLNKVSNKIYARKCSIINISGKDKVDFLNKNHIQGDTTSKYNYALVFNDDVVSLMTFSYRHINNKRNFELVRFCSKLDTNVIGGASKLFKYAIKDFNNCEIISYADRSNFNGNLYFELGFNYIHMTEPNYWWVVDGVRKNRYNFTKKKLVNLGEDETLSESEIMKSKGYFRIWGVGMDKFIYKP
jgi:hypothetical protein